MDTILQKKKEEVQQLQSMIQDEINMISSKKEQYEHEINSHLSKIQQLQSQFNDISLPLQNDSLIEAAKTKYNADMKKMSERLIADYHKRIKTIKKKSTQKKKFEIQVCSSQYSWYNYHIETNAAYTKLNNQLRLEYY